MNEENILYADRKVIITLKELVIDSVCYLMHGIKSVRLHFVKHFKYPPLTLMVLGLAGILLGIAGVFTDVSFEEFYIADFLITANKLSVIIGTSLLLMGGLWLSILHNEYMLVITTGEGDSSPISSKRKDYIHGIANALKTAMGMHQLKS